MEGVRGGERETWEEGRREGGGGGEERGGEKELNLRETAGKPEERETRRKLEMKRQRRDLGNYSPNFLRFNLRRSASSCRFPGRIPAPS